jgi:carbamoyl-phosphate synthase large subunit
MVFLSFNDGDKPAGIVVAKRLRDLGLGVAATTGTANYLAKFGLPVDRIVGKLSEIEGSSLENAAALVANGEISFVVNTPHGRGSRQDGEAIRKAANANDC